MKKFLLALMFVPVLANGAEASDKLDAAEL